MKVLEFDDLKTYPDIIPLLEELLQKAKDGQVIGFAGVAFMTENRVAMTLSAVTYDKLYMTIGCMEALKQELIYRGHEIE